MITIIYEDEHLLIVNKPPQIASHPGGVYEDNSLIDLLKKQGHYPQLHLINRLDFDTSGIIICAKLTQTAKALYTKMSERGFNKEYLAVVFGVVKEPVTINQPLTEKRGTHIRWKVKISPEGKQSITEVKPLHIFVKEGKKYTLVVCKPLTGRQHQIRVHLASIKHPIVGDKIYIADRVFKYYTTHEHQLLDEHLHRIKSPRMLLHSFKVSFMFGDEKYSFTASIPNDFLDFLDSEGKNIISGLK